MDRTLAEDSPLLKSLEVILRDYSTPIVTATPAATDATNQTTASLMSAFQRGDDSLALSFLNGIHQNVPALADDPRHSLFKALLLQRLLRTQDANQELARPCNADLSPQHAAVRARFLVGLGKGRDAEVLLTKMLESIPQSADHLGSQSMPLLAIRAEVRAALDDYAGALADRHTAESKVPPEPPETGKLDLSVDHYAHRRQRGRIEEAWAAIEEHDPAYADYARSHPGN